jgi:L-rhamnose mutarotase
MKKFAFKMKLKPGFKEEYRRRHNELWPEVVKLLKDNGISDYNIFFDEETHSLFAVEKIDDSITWNDLSNEPAIKKWWGHLADIMDVNPDNSPVISKLEMVFHLE